MRQTCGHLSSYMRAYVICGIWYYFHCVVVCLFFCVVFPSSRFPLSWHMRGACACLCHMHKGICLTWFFMKEQNPTAGYDQRQRRATRAKSRAAATQLAKTLREGGSGKWGGRRHCSTPALFTQARAAQPPPTQALATTSAAVRALHRSAQRVLLRKKRGRGNSSAPMLRALTAAHWRTALAKGNRGVSSALWTLTAKHIRQALRLQTCRLTPAQVLAKNARHRASTVKKAMK